MIPKPFILHHKIIGKGYPVVFLHGFLENGTMWNNIIPKLPNVQAIIMDLPGHGKSPLHHHSPLSLPLIADAVKTTLTSLHVDHFSIVGHSLGGYVALHLAEDKTLTIDKLVLLHSHPWADSDKKKGDRNRTINIVKYNKSLFINEAIPQLYYEKHREKFKKEIQEGINDANEMDELAIVQTLGALRNREDKTEVLQYKKEKLHIIQGEFDHLIDTVSIQNLAVQAENHFHLIKNIGHMGHIEATDQVVQYLRNVLG
ncbi:MAG TPA: alpha/beta hydrolase [Brumimicrobium sp.]|nr:alpha/beta hydrolase [Brumimicrobium sp.]